jgi:hypothetical protein
VLPACPPNLIALASPTNGTKRLENETEANTNGEAGLRGKLDVWTEQPGGVRFDGTSNLARRNAEYICQKLDGITYNPNPNLVPLRPIVLAGPVRAALDSASEYLVGLIHRVCWSLTDEPAALARRAGLRPDQVPLLGVGGVQNEIDYAACNGRLDVLLKDGHPVFLEANFSAANPDPVIQHFLAAAYRDLYGIESPPDTKMAGGPFAARARLYRKILLDHQLPKTVAIVGTKSDKSVGDDRYYAAEVDYLRTQGIDGDFVEMACFEAPNTNKQYSIAVKHFLSEYWKPMGLPLKAMAAAHAETVFIVPDSGRSLTSKIVFAWLSAGSVPLSASDRHFVQQHIPWTRITERGEVEFEGRSWNLRDLAVERRADFVLKPLTSHGGNGVVLGRNAEPGAWRRSIDEAVELRDHVVQQYVKADEFGMDFFNRKTGQHRYLDVAYVLGCYMVDGTNAGRTIRHVPGNAPGVVNFELGASFNIVL